MEEIEGEMEEKIELKQMDVCEPIKLLVLKSRYNHLASQLNNWLYTLSDKQQKDITKQIKQLKVEIDFYMDS